MIKTIYKKDSQGNIRFLEISAVEDTVVQKSGIVGTDSPVTNISQCEPKNVGKSNATTAEEQAVLEAQSKLTLKLKTGYFETIEEAQELGGENFLLPMLAKDYKKEAKKVRFPCYVQPKLDGMRCLSFSEKGMTKKVSRKGEPITTLEHIQIGSVDYPIDGELYAHGLSFQENMKLIKKYREGESEQVKYHVYDLVSDFPFPERYLKLYDLVQGLDHIELVHCQRIHSEEELIIAHQGYLSQGYEGTMIRHSEEGYQVNKRSSQLLKYKDFLDEIYTVVDVIPSESRPEQGVVVCEILAPTTDGKTLVQHFKCGMKFPHAEREEILTNASKYIGQKAEIRFFEFTDGGIPRFPVCVGFRLDK